MCVLLPLQTELIVEILGLRHTGAHVNLLRILLAQQRKNVARGALPRLVIIKAEHDTLKRKIVQHSREGSRQFFRRCRHAAERKICILPPVSATELAQRGHGQRVDRCLANVERRAAASHAKAILLVTACLLNFETRICDRAAQHGVLGCALRVMPDKHGIVMIGILVQ